jgi:hypothetical protein
MLTSFAAMSKLEQAFHLFDQYNQQDPEKISYQGSTYAAENFYALQLHTWVTKLDSAAGEALLLASRCQHIGRWEVPRETYPDGKAGYLKWRSDLGKYHAEKAENLLQQIGYDDATIQHVQHIVRKEDLRNDKEVQVIEDGLCLVFLEFQYEDFIQEHDDDKVIHILRRSWKKMSERGQKAATELSFSGRGKELLERALS